LKDIHTYAHDTNDWNICTQY